MTQQIELEDDPVPIVRIMAGFLRAQLEDPGVARHAASMRGTFALRSTVDPQAVTISLTPAVISLRRGVHGAAITIHLDFNRMSDPDHKPRVEGLLRHPLLALRVARLMTPAAPPDWTVAARRFWALAKDQPGAPRCLRIINTDDGSDLVLGDGDVVATVHGATGHLVNFLTGGSVLVDDLLNGRLRASASMRDIVLLSEISLNILLGDLRHE